jgi:vancomycin resistance protein VanW
MRSYVPRSIKRFLRLQQRKARDRSTGLDRRFATSKNAEVPRDVVLAEIRQPIRYNPLSANKVDSIRIAIGHIEAITIHPGEIFSFWEVVGRPTARRGFKSGRTIVGGRLEEDIGGGLCQVSGMIYHLALSTGMKIIERYSHTLDLYDEDTRYTPLGADAGVVFGYKDLRFENPLSAPVGLTFSVDQRAFVGRLQSDRSFPRYDIVFEREDHGSHRTVQT